MTRAWNTEIDFITSCVEHQETDNSGSRDPEFGKTQDLHSTGVRCVSYLCDHVYQNLLL